MNRVGIEVSLAISEAVKLADTDVVSAYPITPQTHIVEGIAKLIAKGELDAESICVESEHSAMSACLGAAAAGARTFTATAGQGLELMHEVLFVASAMRLPIVMTVANRALSSPLSVWGDHSDVMAARDIGWIQVFCESGQDAFDSTLFAFRIAEDPGILFPVMVNVDGFHLTHVVEPIFMPTKEEVLKFLPPNRYPTPLNPAKPLSMGAFAPPNIYSEIKKATEVDFENSLPKITAIWDEFFKVFGRKYNPVETYKADDAETLLLTMGSYSQTAEIAIDSLREKGKKIGLVKIRLWRPFPSLAFKNAVKNCKNLIILDRAISAGAPFGPVAMEIKSVLYNEPAKPKIVGFIAGLGGRDMLPEHFIDMIERGEKMEKETQKVSESMFGVRE